MSAIEQWQNQVETHHAQSIKAQEGFAQDDDFWRPFAAAFRADPRRSDDLVLNRLIREVSPGQTVLDVGGGAGRFALPLALNCRSVTVVDSSDSMLAELRDGAWAAGINNVVDIQGAWEEASPDVCDVALCSHVVYGIADIASFVKKLGCHASERVIILSFVDSPQSHLASLWEAVHGEERVNLPALPELLNVLWEIGIFPDLEMFNTNGPHLFESLEEAVEQVRRRLYVNADTKLDQRLHAAVQKLLIETPDGLVIKGARHRRQGLITWRTS